MGELCAEKVDPRFFVMPFLEVGREAAGNPDAAARGGIGDRRAGLRHNLRRQQDNRRARRPCSFLSPERTAQTNGTVKTTEQPAPSTTATVNTLRPKLTGAGALRGKHSRRRQYAVQRKTWACGTRSLARLVV